MKILQVCLFFLRIHKVLHYLSCSGHFECAGSDLEIWIHPEIEKYDVRHPLRFKKKLNHFLISKGVAKKVRVVIEGSRIVCIQLQ
jgi:hypothetical protein